MNMKKTIAAVAASALAISAVAVPANAANDPANYAVGGNLTYSLVKNFYKPTNGSAVITSTGGIVDAANGFSINLAGVDTTKPITVSVVATDESNFRFNQTFTLTGGDANFVPGVISAFPVGSVPYGAPTFLIVGAGSLRCTTANVTVTGSFSYNGTYAGAFLAEVNGGGHSNSLKLLDVGMETTTNINTGARTVGSVVTSSQTLLKKPYKSMVNAISTGPADIINWLTTNQPNTNPTFTAVTKDGGETTGVGGAYGYSDGKYDNLQPVLNDILANYNDVTFTFNTATDAVITYATQLTASPLSDNDIKARDYDGFYATNSTFNPWNGKAYNEMYKVSFGQQLYNWYGDEATGYVPFDTGAYFTNGIAYNLFSGALIINGNLSMQLADTDVFSYGATGLTFDYQALQSKAYGNYNSYLNLIWSMQLATSVPWYWESLTISYANTADDTADTGAGTTSEDEVLPDDTDDADLDADLDALDAIDEPEVPAEPVEEPAVVVDEPAAAEEPAAPAANPATGNAPIALAVIPVALAAAAIIAKKRK